MKTSVRQHSESCIIHHQPQQTRWCKRCDLAFYEFHETCHSVKFIVLVNSQQRWKQKQNRICFNLGVNWLWRCGVTASFGVFFSWKRTSWCEGCERCPAQWMVLSVWARDRASTVRLRNMCDGGLQGGGEQHTCNLIGTEHRVYQPNITGLIIRWSKPVWPIYTAPV